MRRLQVTITVVAALAANQARAFTERDALCESVRFFVASVQPGHMKEFTFHTVWGTNFKGRTEPVLFARECVHGGYGPAKAVCTYLLQHGAVEFSASNAQRVLTCLSPDTRLGAHVNLEHGVFSLSYGGEWRGSSVTVAYGADEELGGMVLHVTAKGY
jgi:hypothetical protein